MLRITQGCGWTHDGMPKAASDSNERSKDDLTSGVHGGVVRIADRAKEGVDGRDTCRLTSQGDKSLNMASYCACLYTGIAPFGRRSCPAGAEMLSNRWGDAGVERRRCTCEMMPRDKV